MTLIVDASVALKWYLADEPYAPEARAILRNGEPLVAPDIVIAETCNAAWRGVRVGRIDRTQAEEIGRSLPNMFATLIGASTLARRAITIAIELDHAVYDCFYLAFAEVAGIALITADNRFFRKTRNTTWAAKVGRLGEQRS